MSTLKENVQKVVDANAAIKSALEAKGVTVPAAAKLSDAAALIASIKTGGGSAENEWTPPADYPDLTAMLAADAEDAVGKVFLLYELTLPGLVTWKIANISRYTKVTWLDCETGVETQYTAANTVVTPTSRFTIMKLYGATKDFIANYESGVPYSSAISGEAVLGFGIRWVAANDCSVKVGYSGWVYRNRRYTYAFDGFTSDKTAYTNNTAERSEVMFRPYKMVTGAGSVANLFQGSRNVRTLKDSLVMGAGATSCSYMFQNCHSLAAVPDALDLSACTNCTYMFQNCYSLAAVPDALDLSACTNCSSMFNNCTSLAAVPDALDLSACTNCSSMFNACYSLAAVPDALDLSACTNCSSMFNACTSLAAVPDALDLSACTNCTYMFQNCTSLAAVPDALDLSACTNCSYMFNNCTSLAAVPTHLAANGDNNLQISFASSTLVSKASVEAMADNLNDLTGSAKPPTVTFSSATKALFATDEWTALKTKFADKGWNVSPA